MKTPSAPGDPVRVLLHRHSTLCERAVDPLEIAAGLEASGVTDRTAAHCLHRDVFSLAEELYARAPRTATLQARLPTPEGPARSPLEPELREPGASAPEAPGPETTGRGALGREAPGHETPDLEAPPPGAPAADAREARTAGTSAWTHFPAEHFPVERFPVGHVPVWHTPDTRTPDAAIPDAAILPVAIPDAGGPDDPGGRVPVGSAAGGPVAAGAAMETPAVRAATVRVSAREPSPEAARAGSGRRRVGRMCVRGAVLVLPLLPGLLCAGTLAWLALLADRPPLLRGAVGAAGAAAVLGSVLAAVRTASPARLPPGAPAPFPVLLWLCVCWLTGYALFGDWLLEELLGGGPEPAGGLPPPPPSPPPHVPLGLALAVVPAVWATRVFARAARRRLEGSRSLEEFAAGTRPLLALAVTGFAATLPALHWAARAVTDALAPSGTPLAEEPSRPASWAAAALALLLFAALLPGAHGFGRAARTGLATACALEAAALLTVPAARLPGLGAVARPVEVLAAHHGVAAVPLAACACAALGLLAYAAVALTGATAHHREEESV